MISSRFLFDNKKNTQTNVIYSKQSIHQAETKRYSKQINKRYNTMNPIGVKLLYNPKRYRVQKKKPPNISSSL